MRSHDGIERRTLVIVTTLQLDPEGKKYKKKLVDRLSDEAAIYLSERPDVTDYILIGNPKDWND
jgi:hypothetical protein